MMGFVAKVVLISSSGALAPGPLTAATAAIGVRGGWRGGLKVAVGHTLVEAPLIAALGLGLIAALSSPTLLSALSVVGGLFMLGFAGLTLRDALAVRELKPGRVGSSPIMVGVGLSALNPLFILWWASAGASLVVEALLLFGAVGLLVLYASHVWLDYLWLALIAHLTSLGGASVKAYRGLLAASAMALAAFALDFLSYGLTGVRLMPL